MKYTDWDADPNNQKAPAESDEWKPTPGKKDTRKWCKGHPGREHKPTVVMGKWAVGYKSFTCKPRTGADRFWWPMDKHGWMCFHEVVCEVCKKRLADTPDRCPENVEE